MLHIITGEVDADQQRDGIFSGTMSAMRAQTVFTDHAAGLTATEPLILLASTIRSDVLVRSTSC